MIMLYLGRRGAGKTLSMVKDAYLYYKSGRRIISNMSTLLFGEHMSNEEILRLTKDSDIVNCVIVVDEVQLLFDSRRSMKKENITFSNFIQQIRKRGIIMLGTTQFDNTIDKRLRDHTDVIALPKFNKDFLMCRVKYIDPTSNQDSEFSERELLHAISTFDATFVFKLYNTNEMY